MGRDTKEFIYLLQHPETFDDIYMQSALHVFLSCTV